MLKKSFRSFLNTGFNQSLFLKNNQILNNFNKIQHRNFSANNVKDKSDIFLNNITIDKLPNNIASYNDLDFSMSTEILKNFDIENLSTMPYFVGRFSRLFCLSEDILNNISMFLSHELGLGLGISTIIISIGLRLTFFKVNLRNTKNLKINRLLFTEKKEINKKLREIKGGPLQFIEKRKIKLIDEKFGILTNPLLHFFTTLQIFCTFTFTCLIQRFCFHVEDYPEITYGGFLWFKDLSVMDPYYILPFIQVLLSILSIYTNITAYSTNTAISLRRFSYMIPIVSLPVFLTFESGLVLYFCSAQINLIAFNLFVNSEYGNKYIGIPKSIPGSVHDKVNPSNKGEIPQSRKMESSKVDEEFKFDDKKEKLYDMKLKNFNKETISQSYRNTSQNNPNKNK